MQTWLVTGGAGFIGGNFVLDLFARKAGVRVINLDALTYAGNMDTLAALADEPGHVFVQGDIGDRDLVARLLAEYQPQAIVNFAAESHVDRSIDGPAAFVQTNVNGTFTLLEETRRAGALLIVNDRIDVALAIGADGAHVGDDDLPVSAIRRIVPPGFLLSMPMDGMEDLIVSEGVGAAYNEALDPELSWVGSLDVHPYMHWIKGRPWFGKSSPPGLFYRHFRGINTNWKDQRTESAHLRPEDLMEDAEFASLVARNAF